MPGSYEMAKAIANGEIEALNVEWHRISDDEPKGCDRRVYRIGDVVYKKEFGEEISGRVGSDNEREYNFFTYYKNEPWSSPVSLYDVGGEKILCMPYYAQSYYAGMGELGEIEDAWCAWADMQPNGDHAFSDFHGGNYRADDNGQIKIIDGAGSSWDRD